MFLRILKSFLLESMCPYSLKLQKQYAHTILMQEEAGSRHLTSGICLCIFFFLLCLYYVFAVKKFHQNNTNIEKMFKTIR